MDIIKEINRLEYVNIEIESNHYYMIRFNQGWDSGKLIAIINTDKKEYKPYTMDPQIEKIMILNRYCKTTEDFLDIVVKTNMREGKHIPYDKVILPKVETKKSATRQIFILGDET